MLFVPTRESRAGELDEQLRCAQKPDAALISRIVADMCTRVCTLRRAGGAARIDHLIAVEAWNDLALALVELELPAWTVRRLVHEDGEWHCALSRQPNLPLDVDDITEASHASLPLAILCALLEARRAAPPALRSPVPSLRIDPGQAVCCDNFA